MTAKRSAELTTEIRIVRAATKLFADYGFDGVSIREILALAEANVASVNYYFGSKEKLYHAVVHQYAQKINMARDLGLERVRDTYGFTRDTLPEVLRAYSEPHFAVAKQPGGSDYVRMFSRLHTEPRDIAIEFYEVHFGKCRAAYVSALNVALKPIAKDDLRRGFSFFVTSMLSAPSDVGYSQLTGKASQNVDYSCLCEQLVRYHAAGLLALAK